jgi:hypothetical protein
MDITNLKIQPVLQYTFSLDPACSVLIISCLDAEEEFNPVVQIQSKTNSTNNATFDCTDWFTVRKTLLDFLNYPIPVEFEESKQVLVEDYQFFVKTIDGVVNYGIKSIKNEYTSLIFDKLTCKEITAIIPTLAGPYDLDLISDGASHWYFTDFKNHIHEKCKKQYDQRLKEWADYIGEIIYDSENFCKPGINDCLLKNTNQRYCQEVETPGTILHQAFLRIITDLGPNMLVDIIYDLEFSDIEGTNVE